MLLNEIYTPIIEEKKLSRRNIDQFFNLCQLLTLTKWTTLWGHFRQMQKHTQPLKRKNLSQFTQNTFTF